MPLTEGQLALRDGGTQPHTNTVKVMPLNESSNYEGEASHDQGKHPFLPSLVNPSDDSCASQCKRKAILLDPLDKVHPDFMTKLNMAMFKTWVRSERMFSIMNTRHIQRLITRGSC